MKYPRESRQFRSSHLPAIARAYNHVWDLVLDDGVIPDRMLNEISAQIRNLIFQSNRAPVTQARIRVPLPSSRT